MGAITGSDIAKAQHAMHTIAKVAKLGASMSRAMELRHLVEVRSAAAALTYRPSGHPSSIQGRGIGRALLRAFLEKADQNHIPAYLEAEVDKNVRLYESEGFK